MEEAEAVEGETTVLMVTTTTMLVMDMAHNNSTKGFSLICSPIHWPTAIPKEVMRLINNKPNPPSRLSSNTLAPLCVTTVEMLVISLSIAHSEQMPHQVPQGPPLSNGFLEIIFLILYE